MRDVNTNSERTRKIANITWKSLIVNLVLSGFKFAAGVLGNSQAVVADSIHSFSDSFTDIVILWGARYWDRPPDQEHPHGHKRLEIVLTLVIAMALLVVAFVMMFSSIAELRKGDDNETAIGIIAGIAALTSVIVKEWLYRWTMVYARRLHSQVLVANAWHHRSDGLSSIPVTITSVIAFFAPVWSFLDHIGSVVVSVFIVIAAYKIGRPAFDLLIDAGASQEVMSKIRDISAHTRGVVNVHNLRTRYIGSSSIAVDMHVVVDGDISVKQGHDIADNIERRIEQEVPQAVDIVVHIEPKS